MDELSSDLDKTTLGARPPMYQNRIWPFYDFGIDFQGQIIEFSQTYDNFVSNVQIWLTFGQNRHFDFSKYGLDHCMTLTVKVKSYLIIKKSCGRWLLLYFPQVFVRWWPFCSCLKYFISLSLSVYSVLVKTSNWHWWRSFLFKILLFDMMNTWS